MLPGLLSALQAIVAIPFLLFIPGYFLSRLFFAKLGVVERIAVSVGLSIATVTLSILGANFLFGLSITTVHMVAVIAFDTVVPAGIFYGRAWRRRRSVAASSHVDGTDSETKTPVE